LLPFLRNSIKLTFPPLPLPQLRRAETERDSAIETSDSLTSRLNEAEATLRSDTRLQETSRELTKVKAEVSHLSSQYKNVLDEKEIFATRVKQLESGAASTAEIKREKEKKEFGEKIEKMEEKIARLETVRRLLFFFLVSPLLCTRTDHFSIRAGQNQPRRSTSRSQGEAGVLPPSVLLLHLVDRSFRPCCSQDTLEQLKTTLERENRRLEEQAHGSESLAQKAEKALGDVKSMSQEYKGGCSAEEKKRFVVAFSSFLVLLSSTD
jgi:septal ring factor EnvC (AmiA/AmiB activator)